MLCDIKPYLIVLLAFFACHLSVFAQEADSLEVLRLHTMCEAMVRQNEGGQVLELSTKAMRIADRLSNDLLKGRSYYYQGRAFALSQNHQAALNYYLQAIYSLGKANAKTDLASVYEHMGTLYNAWGIYERAIIYAQKALAILPNEVCINCLETLGYAQLALLQYEEAQKTYTTIVQYYQKGNHPAELGNSYGQLAFIAQMLGQQQQALAYGIKRIEHCIQAGEPRALGNAYNNMGFACKQLGRNREALAYFKQAIDALQQASKTNGNLVKDASIWSNMGVSYDQIAQHKQAEQMYLKSLELAKKQNNPSLIAQSYNYLAASYFVAGNKAKALESLVQAVTYAEKGNDMAGLSESYGIYSELYRYDERFKDSQYYDRLRQEIEAQIAKAQAKQKETELQELLEAERRENEYISVIAEKERQALNIRQLALEKEKLELEKHALEKEQKVLQQEKELQVASLRNERLASQQAQQALLLAKKQLDAEQQKREIAGLEANQERQRLELAQKELEEKERQKAIELLESDKMLQEERLAKEEASRRFSYWLFGLFALLFVIVAFSFIMQRKSAKKQKQQAQEIQQKNEELLSSEEELRQNMEELEATQEVLTAQKEQLEGTYLQLESKSNAVTNSIRYAETIQTAILPSTANLSTAFADQMVLYLPKDIVSGDFYWLSEQQGYTFIVVADCTGHGVPGAFMSMIGHSLLSQIINEKDIFDTGRILDELNTGVVKALKQQDSDNTDGMDLSLCRLRANEQGGWDMAYSGAKSKIMILGKEGLVSVGSDNLPIGGVRRKKADRTFSSQEIQLAKGDIVYMMTDGYVDTANTQRKRFGTARLMQVIEQIGSKPLKEQKNDLLTLLQEHQGDEPQRDDVTILAFKV